MVNRKRSEYVFYISLSAVSLLFFLIPVGAGYVIFDDSRTYIEFLQLKNVEGVMPLYPLFLFANKLIFGKGLYLQAVVFEQTLTATICIIYFISKMKQRFRLCYKECCLIFLFSLVPFTTDYPLSMITQDILTEGLTYALFYIWVILVLDTVWDRSFAKLSGAFCFTFILSLLRSQLQILFAICGAAVAYMICVKYSGRNRWFCAGKVIVGFIMWVVIMGGGVIGTVRINHTSQRVMFGEGKTAEFIANNSQDMLQDVDKQDPIEDRESEEFDTESKIQAKAIAEIMEEPGEDITQSAKPAPNTAPEVIEFLSNGYEESGVAVSQYSSLIFSKAMYEADYEDYLLFEDEEVQKQFLYVYDIVDTLEYRYPYADSGLRGWKHISDSVGDLGKHCFLELNQYFADYYNTTIAYFQYRCTAQAFNTIGTKLLWKHFGRFIWHTVRLMIPAFIFTVFFQKEQIYLLCHLVTLFLYVTAIGLMIWCFANKRVNRKYAEFMFVVLANNIIMVTAISLVFIGLQRYLVYAFGIFYVAYYLLVKEFYKCYFAGKGWKWRRREK